MLVLQLFSIDMRMRHREGRRDRLAGRVNKRLTLMFFALPYREHAAISSIYVLLTIFIV